MGPPGSRDGTSGDRDVSLGAPGGSAERPKAHASRTGVSDTRDVGEQESSLVATLSKGYLQMNDMNI